MSRTPSAVEGGAATGAPRDSGSPPRLRRVALLGNPNTGKTTLFNRLCGLRAKTANFPGSTVERHVGTVRIGSASIELIDLPGIYSLSLALPESRICTECLEGRIGDCVPEAAILVVDATNLSRNLQFVQAALRRHLPMVVAVNFIDVALRRGLTIDAAALAARLGAPVVLVSARTGEGLDELVAAAVRAADAPWSTELARARLSALPAAPEDSEAVARWASEVAVAAAASTHLERAGASGSGAGVGAARHEDGAAQRAAATSAALHARSRHSSLHERFDLVLTHPVAGILSFVVVMALLFASIFWVAGYPMDGVDWLVGQASALAQWLLPEGALQDLVVDGVIGGVGATLIFLPQICLLFFLITLMEDSGYLARAAIAVDRVMSKFGLPGQAFIPLLSSHACALPGILSARLIPDRRDRVASIFVAPFMSCSARLGVYTLVISMLFVDRPWLAALAFVGCYAVGALAGMLTALAIRRTILPGRSRPMVIELPDYRWPSLRTALATMAERGILFLRNAGTVILAISIVMWWLSAYPRAADDPRAAAIRIEAEAAATAGDPERAEALGAEADRIQHRVQQDQSFAGRMGDALEPLFSPLGFDRQLTIGVLTSFLAREVFASTMTVLAEAPGDDPGEREVVAKVQAMTRDDGSPLFTIATCASTLVFFVLAMQCLPTMALVKREIGSWGWMWLQFAWMSGVAWVAAFLVYHGLRWMGFP